MKYVLEKKDVVIYGAGKTWSAPILKEMRDTHGFNINSRWIDMNGLITSAEQSYDYDKMDLSYLEKLWDKGCKIDACFCDMGVVVARPEDGEMHSGSLVEIGHITASYPFIGVQKPIYLVGTCKSFEKVGHSDRAFTKQRVFHRFDTLDVLDGFNSAFDHYVKNYSTDWMKFRVYLKKNPFAKAVEQYCRGKGPNPALKTA